MSHAIVWQFDIQSETREAFEEAYGPRGTWAQLFMRGSGYLGTELYRELDVADRYVVIDRWRSEQDFQAFREAWRADYDALDTCCEALTVHEVRLARCVAVT